MPQPQELLNAAAAQHKAAADKAAQQLAAAENEAAALQSQVGLCDSRVGR
jgi:hypothetical protein